MEQRLRWWLIGVSGGAAVIRFQALFANTFHADEALFATWARMIAVWRDPLLQTQLVDKPPLLFYLQALFYPLQGPVEWAARLPNFIASILCVPLVGIWVWRLYEDGKTAVWAAAILALSPLAIRFSATAFTDPLLTTFLFAALTLTVSKKPRLPVTSSHVLDDLRINSSWAGVCFGLALATKYQAVLFMPLLIATAALVGWSWSEWRRWLLGLLPILLLLLIWDVARTGTFSLWSAQMSSYGGLRLIWSWELGPRLVAWWQLWLLAWGSAVLAVGFWLTALWLVSSKQYVVNSRQCVARSRQDYLVDTILVLFIISYLALHWLLAVPVWERYLLPIMPLTAVILARAWRKLEIKDWRLSGLQPLISNLLLPLLLFFPAFKAHQGQPTADQGAAQIAQLLVEAPYGTVLYDHWYSWQWRYHLFDQRCLCELVPSSPSVG